MATSDQGERTDRRIVGRLGAYLAGAALLLVIGAALGAQGARWWGSDEPSETAALRADLARVQAALSVVEERNWEYYRQNQALEEQLDRLRGGSGVSTSTTLEAAKDPPGAYTDGVYLVGEDIAPGSYDGTVTDRVGYWARLRNTAGMIDGIAANALVRGPFVLTIYETDIAVELQGVRLTPR